MHIRRHHSIIPTTAPQPHGRRLAVQLAWGDHHDHGFPSGRRDRKPSVEVAQVGTACLFDPPPIDHDRRQHEAGIHFHGIGDRRGHWRRARGEQAEDGEESFHEGILAPLATAGQWRAWLRCGSDHPNGQVLTTLRRQNLHAELHTWLHTSEKSYTHNLLIYQKKSPHRSGGSSLGRPRKTAGNHLNALILLVFRHFLRILFPYTL